jgi:hypothetical protein
MADGSNLAISVTGDNPRLSNSRIKIRGDGVNHERFFAYGGTVSLFEGLSLLNDSSSLIEAVIVDASEVMAAVDDAMLDGMIGIAGLKVDNFRYPLLITLDSGNTFPENTILILDYAAKSLKVKSDVTYPSLAAMRTQTLYCTTGATVHFVDQLGFMDPPTNVNPMTDLTNGSYASNGSRFDTGDGCMIVSRVTGTAFDIAAGAGALILDFLNDPYCPTAFTDGEGIPVLAHIYASNGRLVQPSSTSPMWQV